MDNIDLSHLIVCIIFIVCLGIASQGALIELAPTNSNSVSANLINGLAIVGIGLSGMMFSWSWWGSKRTEKILEQNTISLGEIKNRLNSSIVITYAPQQTGDENISKKDVNLLLRGVIIGLWAGILGALFSSSLFEILKHSPLMNDTQTSSSFSLTVNLIIFFVTLICLLVLTVYANSIIQKLES
jgi:hypothetical protein